jgi:hypothetical protein
MAASIRFLAALIVLSVSGCASHNGHSSSQSIQDHELFVVIEWIGVQTRPPWEIAYATEGLSKGMASWLAESPGFRKGALFGNEDTRRIRAVLSGSDFASHQVTAEPDFRTQQYVLRLRNNNAVTVFALGLDGTTQALLKELQEALPEKPALIMQPLIDCFQNSNHGG